MARPRKLEGVETRIGGDGIQRYRGMVRDGGRKLRGPWTVNLDEAVTWRQQMIAGVRDGLVAHRRINVGDAAREWLEGIEDGSIRNRSGQTYKPSVVKGYRRDILICADVIGRVKVLDELRIQHAQQLMKRLRKDGLSDSRVRHVMMTLRAMFNWALPEGYATVNPCIGLRVPRGREQRRERIADAKEAALLVGALEVPDRTAFALACYAGLRAGELLSLRWSDIDLETSTIRIDRAVDTHSGDMICPKSEAAYRSVPIQACLHAVLEDHAEHTPAGLLFPSTRPRRGARRPGDERVWSHSGLVKRLAERWEAAGLEPLGLHEARHTFASAMIAARLGPKTVQTYMGHSSITITFDRYGHLFPGHEAEALRLLNEYQEARS